MKILNTCAALALTAFAAAPAFSAVIISGQEVGSDVVFSYTGTLDVTGLVDGNRDFSSSYVTARDTSGGTQFNSMSGYTFFSGSISTNGGFGNSVATSKFYIGSAAIVTGNSLGFDRSIYVDTDFVSGDDITGSATFTGETFATLGLTSGTSFIVSLPNDTITVNIGPVAAVPLPASAPLFLAALGGLGLMRRRKKTA